MALSPADRVLFLKLWGLLDVVSILLRLLDYHRACRMLLHFVPDEPKPPGKSDDAMTYALRVGDLARVAGRHLPVDASCLRQSLLVWWLLRRRGLPAELRIGVSKREAFTAHAWVELNDRPVNNSANVAELFTAVDRAH